MKEAQQREFLRIKLSSDLQQRGRSLPFSSLLLYQVVILRSNPAYVVAIKTSGLVSRNHQRIPRMGIGCLGTKAQGYHNQNSSVRTDQEVSRWVDWSRPAVDLQMPTCSFGPCLVDCYGRSGGGRRGRRGRRGSQKKSEVHLHPDVLFLPCFSFLFSFSSFFSRFSFLTDASWSKQQLTIPMRRVGAQTRLS